MTVWVNGERKGVMVHPGMTGVVPQTMPPREELVGRLQGPLRWAVDLGNQVTEASVSVAIAGPYGRRLGKVGAAVLLRLHDDLLEGRHRAALLCATGGSCAQGARARRGSPA